MMLRSKSSQNSGKITPKTTKIPTRVEVSPLMSTPRQHGAESLTTNEFVESLIPILSEKIHEALTTNMNEEFKKVNECIAMNLSKINEQLDVIGKRHERIESELTSIAQSVVNLQGPQKDTNEKIATLKNAVERNTLDMAEMQNNIRDLTETKQIMEQDINSVKENLVELVKQKVQEALQQQSRPMPPTPETSAERQNVSTQAKLDIMTACRLEAIEQYNRRDCLLFFGLYETEEENTTEKVVETARAMGVNISYTDVSISHRLQTRNRKRGEPKPIIAKFTRRTVKNDILKSKHHLKHSDNHYNVYVQEQLTRERSTALYQLKKEGFRVFTNESRLEYTKGELHGTISSLEELRSKLGWDDEKLIEVLKK